MIHEHLNLGKRKGGWTAFISLKKEQDFYKIFNCDQPSLFEPIQTFADFEICKFILDNKIVLLKNFLRNQRRMDL